MAKKRRNSRRPPQKKSSLGKWLLLVVVGVLTYKGADYFLPRLFSDKPSGSIASNQKKSSKGATQNKISQTPSQKAAQKDEAAVKDAEKKPLASLSLEETQKLLPKNAFPDNFDTIPMETQEAALISHAKTISGKKPGPKGETNTQPGLRYVKWTGQDYQNQDLNFDKLKPALGSLASKKMVGLPKVEASPFAKGKSELYLAKMFFEGDNREVLAVIEVNDKGADWASLHHASGKKIPAAFSQGTTKETTRQVLAVKHDGKPYLIVENGELDEFRPYAGYLWSAQAYYWDGSQFVYDSKYSQSLTRSKRLAGPK